MCPACPLRPAVNVDSDKVTIGRDDAGRHLDNGLACLPALPAAIRASRCPAVPIARLRCGLAMRQRRRRCRPSLLPITALSLSTIALGTLLLWGVERPATNRVSPVAIRSSDVMDAPPVCLYQGLTGSMNPDAILTLVITPKSLSSHRNAVSEAKVRFAFRMMASLPDVNVVVLSRNCQVLLLAREMGLPTFQFTTGSDVEDLTYRHVLHVVDRVIPSTSPAVGFSNSDIIFDRSLGDTVRAALAHATSSGWRSWFLQGTRTNFDLPPENLDSLMSSWNAEHPPALKDIVAASGRTFHIDAQDYFIFNRGIELNWHCMPPFLLGGVYFDNWFVGLVNTKPGMEVIDGSQTILAAHIAHGAHRKESHATSASEINLLLGEKHFWAHGFIPDARWSAIKGDGIAFTSKHDSDFRSTHYDQYWACVADRGVRDEIDQAA
ncbi:Nucleotide-diphospho-sugar transferase domain-containing protein [Plasmodiophora brassicae]